jgi:hypothetical protein
MITAFKTARRAGENYFGHCSSWATDVIRRRECHLASLGDARTTLL